ncbi:hypothetical protein D3C71_1465310 [compost metagenome]
MYCQALAYGGCNEARNFGKAIGRYTLVGVANGRVGKTLQHHIAVGGQVDGTGVTGLAQTGDGIVGDVVVSHLANGRCTHAFVDVLQPAERSGPRDTAMAGVENADLGFFIWLHGLHQFHTHALPSRATSNEIILDHPLNEALGRDRRRIIPASGVTHAATQVGRRAWRDAVHHGVGADRVRLGPRQQRRISSVFNEIQ